MGVLHLWEYILIYSAFYVIVTISERPFRKALLSPFFVDKSMLIYDFITQNETLLISAPGKFFKSGNMDMVRTFLELGTDRKGRPERKIKKSYTYKLFKDNCLEIFKKKKFCEEHFSKYPVVYFDFNELEVSTYKTFIASFRLMLANVFNRYRYMEISKNLNRFSKDTYVMYRDTITYENLEEGDFEDAGMYLTNTLMHHFNGDVNNVVVLIQDYDAPFFKSIDNPNAPIKKIYDLLKIFIKNTFKDNISVFRAMITVTINMVADIHTNPPNIKRYLFGENHVFTKYYGYTEQDLEQIKRNVAQTKKKFKSKHIENILIWYCGYHVENTDQRICNPYDVAKYLGKKKRNLKGYWPKTIKIMNFDELMIRREIHKLIMRILVPDTPSLDIEYKNLAKIDNGLKLRKMFNEPIKHYLQKTQLHLYFQFLYEFGILTMIARPDNKTITLQYPNFEILDMVKKVVYNEKFIMDHRWVFDQ